MDDRDRSKAEAIAYALGRMLWSPFGDVGVQELEIRAVMSPGTGMPEPEPVRASIGVVREFMRAFSRYDAAKRAQRGRMLTEDPMLEIGDEVEEIGWQGRALSRFRVVAAIVYTIDGKFYVCGESVHDDFESCGWFGPSGLRRIRGGDERLG